MSRLIVNCRRLPFASTLGVSHGLLQLATALATEHELVFVVNEIDDVDASPARDAIRAIASEVLTSADATARRSTFNDAIEVSPHHFQPREFCDRSIAICYDLHVFDIPWKYGDRAGEMQDKLRRCLDMASAVMTPFPRTYYAVERIAGISIMNLYLTESPLLLDTRPAYDAEFGADQSRPRTILYPAQLQAHKNHGVLIEATARALSRGAELRVVCPGSEFDDEQTTKLMSKLEAADLGTAFEFAGRVSDQELVQMYRTCDGVIVPSAAEGGAYVVLEAIAAGKPVAANAIESATMHAGSLGAEVHWFDGNDVEAATEALVALAGADAADWRSRNSTCRSRLSELDWTMVSSKWNEVIGMLEGERSRPRLLTDQRANRIVLV